MGFNLANNRSAKFS